MFASNCSRALTSTRSISLQRAECLLLLAAGCSEDYKLPTYDATVPTGNGNWQPAPSGPGAAQAAETPQLVP
jgi:hypothetical protein